MSLTLVGLGLHDEKDLSLKGIDEAKNADKCFIELYTSCWHGSIEKLEKIIGKKVEELKRKDLEENSSRIISQAKNHKIVVFAQGDPLVATTHSALFLEAKKKKIRIKIIHNSSIVSAIAEIGLHIYKFGQIVTIPFPEKTKGKLPESIYETIKANRARGLHTLCLLDVAGEEKRFMLPQEAVRILLKIENKRKENVFTDKTQIIAVGKLGSENPVIELKSARDMLNSYFRELPAVLIIPGELHFTEKDYLRLMS